MLPTPGSSLGGVLWGQEGGEAWKGAVRCSEQGWSTSGSLTAGSPCLDFLTCKLGDKATSLCQVGNRVGCSLLGSRVR